MNAIYALIIALVIIIIYNLYISIDYEQRFMSGLWIADEDFCARADIDGMMLYIGSPSGPDVTLQTTYRAYLIMYAKSIIIADKKIGISISSPLSELINPFFSSNVTRNIYLADGTMSIDMEDAVEDPSEIHIKKIMPQSLTAEIDFARGKMTWTCADDGKVYANLYKDYEASSVVSLNA